MPNGNKRKKINHGNSKWIDSLLGIAHVGAQTYNTINTLKSFVDGSTQTRIPRGISSITPGQATESAYSKFRTPIGWKKNLRLHFRDGIKEYYDYNNPARYTSGVGKQSLSKVASTFTHTDVTLAQDWLLLKSDIGAPQYDNVDFFLKSVKMKTHLSNATNTPITCWIYDVFYRQNMPPEATYGNSDPLNAWVNGLGQQETSVNDATTPFATPFESKLFTKYFDVAKVTKVSMDVGCEHVHHFKHSPNRKFNDQQAEAAQTAGFYGKTSHYQFVVLLGAIGNNADRSVVSYMSSAVNCIVTKQYEIGCSAVSYDISKSTNNLSTTASLVRILDVSEDPEPAVIS